MEHMPAILAPAGNLAILKNAVNAGSDGVYFGGTAFNARRNAVNFTDADIAEGAAYAHLRGAKAYLTLNTIIYDEELPDALNELKKAAAVGLDGIIATDLGILRLMRQITPSLSLNTSTQLSAHCPSDCEALEALGADRIVLAREMSREEIRSAAQATNAKIKIFVHGAHCMCVSGQCYFSSALGERSGNRGLCAQVCRLPFTAEAGSDNGYALSLKDMSLLEHIPEFAEMGVDALKIEGRMKSAGYVGVVTLAAIAAREGKTFDPHILRAAFSRSGFTDGYYMGKLGKEMFGVRSEADKRSADIISGYDAIADTPRIPVRINYSARLGEPFSLRFTDPEGRTATASLGVCQAAKSSAIKPEELTERLCRLGNSVYVPESCEGVLEDNIFLPVATINSARRACADELNERRTEIIPPSFGTAKKLTAPSLGARRPARPKIYSQLSAAAQLSEYVLENSARVILPLLSLSDYPAEPIKKYADKITVELPRVYFGDEDILRASLSAAKEIGISSALCHTLGRVRLAQQAGFEVIGGFGLNIANSQALAELAEQSVRECVLSPEINLPRIEKLKTDIPVGLFAYGQFPLMIMRNCPVAAQSGCTEGKHCALLDRKGVRFPLKCENGLTELYNPEPIFWADEISRLYRLDFVLLRFSFESEELVERVLAAYRGENGYVPERFTRGTYKRRLK